MCHVISTHPEAELLPLPSEPAGADAAGAALPTPRSDRAPRPLRARDDGSRRLR
jgi:hypothetical protein